MMCYRQAYIKVVASQSSTNPDKKTNIKYSYHISTLILCNITTLVTHNKTVTLSAL